MLGYVIKPMTICLIWLGISTWFGLDGDVAILVLGVCLLNK